MRRAKIITSNVCPPIPYRQCDWCAYEDGKEEEGKYGYGPTRKDAIKDFLINHEEDDVEYYL